MPIATANASTFGLLDKLSGLFGIGQQLIFRQHAFRTMPVLLFAHPGFERPETSQFAFDRDVDGVRHLDHGLGHVNVVFERGRGLAVRFQRTVHHHAGETVLDRTLARLDAVAVILVHGHRNVRIQFDRRQHQVPQVSVLRVGARTARRLDDDRRVGLFGRFHDRLNLFHVVHVECGNAVIVLGRVVQEDAKRDQCHDVLLDSTEWAQYPCLKNRLFRESADRSRQQITDKWGALYASMPAT